MESVYNAVMGAERKGLGEKIAKNMSKSRRYLQRYSIEKYGISIYSLLILLRHNEMPGVKKLGTMQELRDFVTAETGRPLASTTAFYMVHNAYKRYNLTDAQMYQFRRGPKKSSNEQECAPEIQCDCGATFSPTAVNLAMCRACMGLPEQTPAKQKVCLRCGGNFMPNEVNRHLCSACVGDNKHLSEIEGV